MMVLFGEFVNRPFRQLHTVHRRSLGCKTFWNWKKAVEKMKAHERSDLHIRASQALLVASQEGSVVQQLQRMDKLERGREE